MGKVSPYPRLAILLTRSDRPRPSISGHLSPYIPWTEYALDRELLKDGAARRRDAARQGRVLDKHRAQGSHQPWD